VKRLLRLAIVLTLVIGVIAALIGVVVWRFSEPVGVSRVERIRVSIHAALCWDSGKWEMPFTPNPVYEIYSCLHTHPRHQECVAMVNGAITDVTDPMKHGATPVGLPSGLEPYCLAYRSW
jgi:hypothetical protein